MHVPKFNYRLHSSRPVATASSCWQCCGKQTFSSLSLLPEGVVRPPPLTAMTNPGDQRWPCCWPRWAELCHRANTAWIPRLMKFICLKMKPPFGTTTSIPQPCWVSVAKPVMNIKFCLARDVPRLSATNRRAERSTEAECECMKPFLCRALVVQLETLSVLLPWTRVSAGTPSYWWPLLHNLAAVVYRYAISALPPAVLAVVKYSTSLKQASPIVHVLSRIK